MRKMGSEPVAIPDRMVAKFTRPSSALGVLCGMTGVPCNCRKEIRLDSHRGVSSGLVWVAMLALAGCGAGTAQPSAADAAEMANPRLSTGRSIKPEVIASQDV